MPDTRSIELGVGPIDDPILHTPRLVTMGNPHVVFCVRRSAPGSRKVGPMIEHHLLFPERTKSAAPRSSRDRIAAGLGTGRGRDRPAAPAPAPPWSPPRAAA